MIEIKRAFTGETLRVVSGDTLVGAKLAEANLRGADLSEADLRNADLSGASLRAAEMNDTNLEGANLLNANLLLSNLNRAKLRKADLTGANLEGAGLHRADLRGANLSGSILFGALLTGATYDYATLWPAGFDPEKAGAKLTQAVEEEVEVKSAGKTACPECDEMVADDAVKCRHCGAWLNSGAETENGVIKIYGGSGELLMSVQAENLEEANLGAKNLQGANLVNANMRRAKLVRSDLSRAAMRGAILDGASLNECNLNGANLREATLEKADLSGASLRGSSLEKANLCGAILNGANLREANLSQADLSGADLFGANLYGANLVGVKHDPHTQWPIGFSFDKNGPRSPANGIASAAPATAAPPPQNEFKREPVGAPAGRTPAPIADAPRPAVKSPALVAAAPAPAQAVAVAPMRTTAPPPQAQSPAAPPQVNPTAAEPEADEGAWTEKIACPYCAEIIHADAVKCRFCGEWLVQSPSHQELLQEHPDFRRNRMQLLLTGGIMIACVVLLLSMGGYYFVSKQAESKAMSARLADLTEKQKKDESRGRVLEFPDTPIGALSARPWNSPNDAPWENLGPARGTSPIPPGKELKLIVDSPVTDLSFMRRLGPADLFSLDLILTDIGDDQLANLEGLTGLQELALPSGITDAGLAHLEPLVSLRILNLSITSVTNNGLDALTSLESLQFLFVPSRITEKEIERFKKASPDCSIDKL